MKAYDITQTTYWRKFRQGVRKGPHGSSGKYSRRKRNNDIRFGARINERHLMPHDLQLNQRFQSRFRGMIRRWRTGLEHHEARQKQLRKDLGLC